MGCLFCSVPESEIIIAHDLCFARWDKFPVSPGHTLVVPSRHIESIFDAEPDEYQAFWDLIHEVRSFIDDEYAPDGYNIGINDGRSAGQFIRHMHIHIIPRFEGDVESEVGGVRGVIPVGEASAWR